MTIKQRLRDFFVILPFLAFYLWTVIRTAWVSDDAFITFRSIENFIHGYGPTYNIGVRVQSFTHPLWFLLQSLANGILSPWRGDFLGSSQLYYVNVLLSIGISGAVVILLWLASADTKSAILGIAILSLSKAFVDYSTSGLENPLTHLLVAAFLILCVSNKVQKNTRLFYLALVAALAGLNRIDLLLIFLPAMFYLFVKSAEKIKTLGVFAAGFLPLIVWEIFSIIYYGFPFPNTAYAKLDTGIEKLELLEQGLKYYLNSLRLDPLTLLVILVALVYLAFKKDSLQQTILAGMGLYLLYILSIGGDFMSGRFFTPPLLAATILLVQRGAGSFKSFGVSLAAILLIGIAPIFIVRERSPLFIENVNNLKQLVDTNGISDERNFYYPQMGLLKNLDGSPATYKADWVFHNPQPARVEVVGTLGVAGYRLGPDAHVLDLNALTDPLMARMPLQDTGRWRIGHFKHIIPEGYVETLAAGENLIQDPGIARHYDQLSVVVSGEVWSWERFVVIWGMNTGAYKIGN
jgi:arabinofuranosyltransferase